MTKPSASCRFQMYALCDEWYSPKSWPPWYETKGESCIVSQDTHAHLVMVHTIVGNRRHNNLVSIWWSSRQRAQECPHGRGSSAKNKNEKVVSMQALLFSPIRWVQSMLCVIQNGCHYRRKKQGAQKNKGVAITARKRR